MLRFIEAYEIIITSSPFWTFLAAGPFNVISPPANTFSLVEALVNSVVTSFPVEISIPPASNLIVKTSGSLLAVVDISYLPEESVIKVSIGADRSLISYKPPVDPLI